MLTLNLDMSPRWLTLAPGVDVLVRPLHHGIWLAAKGSDAATAAEQSRDAQDWTFAIGVEVAKRTITDWRGVGDAEGVALPVTPEAITALMHLRDPFDAFFDQVIGPWMGITDEKKGFAPLPDGTSAGVPTIATAATASAPNARAASTRRKAKKA
jgi:hypothetical protein